MNRSMLSGLGALATVLAMAGCMKAAVDPVGKAPLQILGGTLTACPNVQASGPYPAYCNIKIQLSVSGNVCAATVLNSPASYASTASSTIDNKRLIVWQLQMPSAASGATFAFIAGNGVVITKQSTAQVYDLKPGDGMANNGLEYYHAYNMQNQVSEASYFPLVQMTDSKGNQSLCAALDPKIVNMN